MTKHRALSAIMIILFFIVVLFIFINSLQPVEQSKQDSLYVTNIVEPVLSRFVGDGNVTDNLVRKLAHFVEFSVLGTVMMLYCVIRKNIHLQNIANCLSLGLLAAVTDESLQLVSGRGSQVKDILLDFSGVITGTVLVLLIYGICVVIRRVKESVSMR